jgi:hypothetical protein
MFSTSTQRKHWTFTGETQIMQNKKDANQKYVNKHGGSNLDVSPNTISKAIRKIFTAVHKTLNFKPQITQNKKDVN